MSHSISNIIDLTNAPTPPRWFEFLLEPGKLQQHLNTSGCDPSPTQLITLFFRNIPNFERSVVPNSSSPATTNGNGSTVVFPTSPSGNPTNFPNAPSGQTNPPTVTDEVKPVVNESLVNDKVLLEQHSDSMDIHIPPDSYEAKYKLKKAYALQTLAIKVASFLKWDLELLCNDLTIPVQYKLMQALLKACSSSNCPPEVKRFSDILHWDWFLRSAITYQLSTIQPQTSNTTIIYLSQLQQQQQAADALALSSMGELFSANSKLLKACSSDLHSFIWELTHNKDNSPKKMKSSIHPFKKVKLCRPTMDCFDSHNEQLNEWEKLEPLDSKEFLEQTCYDLGRFFFFEESYELAKQSFEIIKNSNDRFPKLSEYLKSSIDITSDNMNGIENANKEEEKDVTNPVEHLGAIGAIHEKRKQTEKYLFDCMSQFSESEKRESKTDPIQSTHKTTNDSVGTDTDFRFDNHAQQAGPNVVSSTAPIAPPPPQSTTTTTITTNPPAPFLAANTWYTPVLPLLSQQQLLEVNKGDYLMAQGNFKEAMGCFVGTIMLMTNYFRIFSQGYTDEEPYITRMIQCSISLSCFTQAVALYQMTKTLNYTIAFKQLNERICNDSCDDIYECIWNVTLLEYIINLHSRRGEVERRSKVIQLIGQLELNENNPEEILREAEHVRRGRFFRILANRYL